MALNPPVLPGEVDHRIQKRRRVLAIVLAVLLMVLVVIPLCAAGALWYSWPSIHKRIAEATSQPGGPIAIEFEMNAADAAQDKLTALWSPMERGADLTLLLSAKELSSYVGEQIARQKINPRLTGLDIQCRQDGLHIEGLWRGKDLAYLLALHGAGTGAVEREVIRYIDGLPWMRVAAVLVPSVLRGRLDWTVTSMTVAGYDLPGTVGDWLLTKCWPARAPMDVAPPGGHLRDATVSAAGVTLIFGAF